MGIALKYNICYNQILLYGIAKILWGFFGKDLRRTKKIDGVGKGFRQIKSWNDYHGYARLRHDKRPQNLWHRCSRFQQIIATVCTVNCCEENKNGHPRIPELSHSSTSKSTRIIVTKFCVVGPSTLQQSFNSIYCKSYHFVRLFERYFKIRAIKKELLLIVPYVLYWNYWF